ncbi:hypothetical protein Chor_005030 [Crotalus horridus]
MDKKRCVLDGEVSHWAPELIVDPIQPTSHLISPLFGEPEEHLSIVNIHPPNSTEMASRWDLCSFTCPPTSVTIQPPPFTVTVPGPALFCPDQPLCIDQFNPCVPQCGVSNYGRPRPLILASTSSQKTVSKY